MLRQITPLLVLLFFLLMSFEGHASRSPEAPKCYFQGLVKDISLRKEPGRGMSEGETHRYIDITIEVTKDNSKNVEWCSKEKMRVVQMHGSLLGVYAPSLPKKESCIRGYSNFFGDGNFKSGNWLTVEEVMEAEDCEVDTQIINKWNKKSIQLHIQ